MGTEEIVKTVIAFFGGCIITGLGYSIVFAGRFAKLETQVAALIISVKELCDKPIMPEQAIKDLASLKEHGISVDTRIARLEQVQNGK